MGPLLCCDPDSAAAPAPLAPNGHLPGRQRMPKHGSLPQQSASYPPAPTVPPPPPALASACLRAPLLAACRSQGHPSAAIQHAAMSMSRRLWQTLACSLGSRRFRSIPSWAHQGTRLLLVSQCASRCFLPAQCTCRAAKKIVTKAGKVAYQNDGRWEWLPQ